MIHQVIPLRDREENVKMTTYIIDDPMGNSRRFPVVVICPGGAYRLCSPREAEPIAMQFNAAGIHAVVVEYSLKQQYPKSLEDLSNAVVLVREHAEEWKIDPDRVFVCGFSAGGHLAGSLGVLWNQEPAIKRADQMNRPNGMILAYPVITTGEYTNTETAFHVTGNDPDYIERTSLERNVTEDCAPAFIWHTFTDASVPVQNAYMLANALCEKGVSTELHIYPYGRHGLALANEYTADSKEWIIRRTQNWIDMAIDWVKDF